MKNLKFILAIILAATIIAFSLTGRADDQKPRPYPLDTCLVCGMKLGDMGKPCIFVYKGQEIKVCNESVLYQFDFWWGERPREPARQ